MIVRSLLLRHGRVALPKPPTPVRSCRRFLSSNLERKAAPIASQNPSEEPAIRYSLPSASGVTYQIQDPTHKVAQDWQFFQHQKAITGKVGGKLAGHYKPHELLSNPPRPKDISLELLLASGSHLGHATSLWHPGNARYIFGIRGVDDPIHIISLDVTAAHLRRACKIVQGVTERGGLVLFVGTRSGQARAVTRAAQLAQGCHLFTRWIPGTITNGQQILARCQKKVVNEHDQEVDGFDEQLHILGAVKPDLVVCLNPLENYILLRECGQNNIPTIGIVDTDCNPTWVTYPIPANDDSNRCVQVIAGVLGRAGQEGQRIRKENAQNGVVDYRQAHGLVEPTEADNAAVLQAAKEKAHAKSLLFDEEDDLDLDGEAEVTTGDKEVDTLLAAELSGSAQETLAVEEQEPSEPSVDSTTDAEAAPKP